MPQQYEPTGTFVDGLEVFIGTYDRQEYVYDGKEMFLLSDLQPSRQRPARVGAAQRLPSTPLSLRNGRGIPPPVGRHQATGRIPATIEVRPTSRSQQQTPPARQVPAAVPAEPLPVPASPQATDYVCPAWAVRVPSPVPSKMFDQDKIGVVPDEMSGVGILNAVISDLTDTPRLIICRTPVDPDLMAEEPEILAGKMRLVLLNQDEPITKQMAVARFDSWVTKAVNNIIGVLESKPVSIEAFSTDWSELRALLSKPYSNSQPSEVKLYQTLVTLLAKSLVKEENGGLELETTVGFIPDIDKHLDGSYFKQMKCPLPENAYLHSMAREVLKEAAGGQAALLTADGVLLYIVEHANSVFLI